MSQPPTLEELFLAEYDVATPAANGRETSAAVPATSDAESQP